MKRFHVHVAVTNLADSIVFYSKLFGQSPTKERPDYAKWMLEDPRINFAISSRGHAAGVNHFGIQVDSADELAAIKQRAQDASGGAVLDQDDARLLLCQKREALDDRPAGSGLGAVPHTERSPGIRQRYGDPDRRVLRAGASLGAGPRSGRVLHPTIRSGRSGRHWRVLRLTITRLHLSRNVRIFWRSVFFTP